MPATKLDEGIRHEDFCIAEQPRIERYVARKDSDNGRSVPGANVVRCQECGAAKYTPVN